MAIKWRDVGFNPNEKIQILKAQPAIIDDYESSPTASVTEDKSAESEVDVVLHLLPEPWIEASWAATRDDFRRAVNDVDVALTISDFTRTRAGQFRMDGKTCSMKCDVVEWGNQDAVTRVEYLVPNLRRLASRSGRCFDFEANGWTAVVEELADREEFDIVQRTEGVTFTHRAVFERLTDNEFDWSDLDDVVLRFSRFLSFLAGWDVNLGLCVGYSIDDDQVWWRWQTLNVSRWQKGFSWWPANSVKTDLLSQAAKKFMETTATQIWRDTVLDGVYWYLLAHHDGGSAEAIVIQCFVAFEMIGWTIVVEDRKLISGDAYRKLTFDDKLSLLLGLSQIDNRIPSGLKKLAAAGKAENWLTASAALAQLRNAFTHHSSKTSALLRRVDSQAKVEAAMFAVQILGLLVLSMIKYKGEFLDISLLRNNSYSATAIVPWVEVR